MTTNKLFFMFSILMSMLATNASAYDLAVKNTDGVMIYYNYYSNDSEKTTVYVTYKTKNYNSYSGSVVIPKEITYNNKTLKVTSIAYQAFKGCGSLKSVTIPNSVTSIGPDAFGKCSSLTSINIPNSVTSIGEYAFASCSSLPSITIPNSVTSIGDAAFSYCSSLTSVTIPNGVTGIGMYAFSCCKSLTSVTIGSSVTYIGMFAFELCSSLKSITIPNSVKWIGEQAFENCDNLTSVTIGNSVTDMGDKVFSGCPALTSIVVEKNNPIYDSRNNCNAIIETKSNKLISGCKNTVIPNNVTSIAKYAFLYCTSLTSITIPNSVTSIGGEAFEFCTSLTSVNIPNGVTSIEGWTFEGCRLKSITIPNSVTSIGDNAFCMCSLKSITIPNSVTSIGKQAFALCGNLQKVTSKIANPFAIKGNTFSDETYSKVPLYVPKGTVAKYKATEGWKNFKNIVEEDTTTGIDDVEADNTLDTSNAIYDINGKRLPATSLDELPSGLYIINGKKVVK